MENKISFMLLYKETPNFEEVALKSRIERLFGDSLTINMFFTNPESTMVNAAFGGDQLMIAGLYVPYPTHVLDQVLPVCHFSEADKKTFYENKTHLLFSLSSTETLPHLLFDRLYQLVNCFVAEDDNAIGIINESAMTANMLKTILEIKNEREALLAEKSMPFWSWLAFTGGFVKYILDDSHIWFVTKGNHQFGLPELAYLGTYAEGNDTLMLFKSLFSYMYGYGAILKPGHTAEMGDDNLEFTELKDYKEVFEGKYGTLVVNKV